MHQVNSKDCAGVNPSAYNSLDKVHNYGLQKRLNGNYFQLIQILVKHTLKFLDRNIGQTCQVISRYTLCEHLQNNTKGILSHTITCLQYMLIHCFSQLLQLI